MNGPEMNERGGEERGGEGGKTEGVREKCAR